MSKKGRPVKQIIAFLLSILMLLAMTACGNTEAGNVNPPAGSAPNTTNATEQAESTKKPESTSAQNTPAPPVAAKDNEQQTDPLPGAGNFQSENVEERTEMKLYVQIGDHTFKATLEDNAAVDAFAKMLEQAPVVLQMSDYGGFEKVGTLGQSLPASNNQTTTQSGDIVLYNGNQIVIFYGSNSWSYTRLGRIDDLSGWQDALGSGDVTVTFSIGE